MAAKADEYRLKASDCELRARQANDPEIRWQFADMARQWREMAEPWDRGLAEQEEGQDGLSPSIPRRSSRIERRNITLCSHLVRDEADGKFKDTLFKLFVR